MRAAPHWLIAVAGALCALPAAILATAWLLARPPAPIHHTPPDAATLDVLWCVHDWQELASQYCAASRNVISIE